MYKYLPISTLAQKSSEIFSQLTRRTQNGVPILFLSYVYPENRGEKVPAFMSLPCESCKKFYS